MNALERVLIVAPHPDDESLAAGGLIQRVTSDGGTVRVLFMTEGENNPWPQRYLYRRWFIADEDRRRWGTCGARRPSARWRRSASRRPPSTASAFRTTA